MSTGTNKERIEQNNLKLEEIKNKIGTLPEYQDIEPIYSYSDISVNELNFLGQGYTPSMLDDYLMIHAGYTSGEKYLFKLDKNTKTYVKLTDEPTSDTDIFLKIDDYINTVGIPYDSGKMYIKQYDKETGALVNSYTSSNSSRLGSEYQVIESKWVLSTRDNTLYISYIPEIKDNFTFKVMKSISYSSISFYCGSNIIRIKDSSNNYTFYKIDTKNNVIDQCLVGNISMKGIDYTGSLIFMGDNDICVLNDDLSIGAKVGTLDFEYSSITPISNSIYYSNKNVYSFNSQTHELTYLLSTPQYCVTANNKFYFKGTSKWDIYSTEPSDNLVGYHLYGRDFYFNETKAVANSSNMLEGYSVNISDGTQVTGTMPNNGELNYTPSTEEQTIPEGYTSGGKIAGDSNLVANNIRLGTTIFGVEGNLEADKPDQTKTVTPTIEEQVITPDTGYELASVTVEAVTSSIDSNIVAENIKKDVNILGVTGTYEGSAGAIDSAEYNELVNMTYDIRNILNLETIVKNNMSVRIDNIRTSNKYLIDIVSTILNLTDFSSNPSLLLSWTDGNGNQLMFGAYCINGYNRVSVRETTKNNDSSVTSITYDYYNEATVNLTGNRDYISAFEQYGEGWFTADEMTMSYRVVPELPIDLTKYVGKTFTVSKNGIENDLILSCLVNMLSSIIFVQGSGV